MKFKLVFRFTLALTLWLICSIVSASEYMLEATGKNETAALGNLKVMALRSQLLAMIGKEEMKKNTKAIRQELFIRADDFVSTGTISYISGDKGIKASGELTVDEEKVRAELERLGISKKTPVAAVRPVEAKGEEKKVAVSAPRPKQAQSAESSPTEKSETVQQKTTVSQTANKNPTVSGAQSLLQAVSSQNLAAVKKLLSDGANPDEKNAEGQTAIVLAAKENNAAIVTALLEAKASVDAEDSFKRTALIYAIKEHYTDPDINLLQALLRAKADPNHKDKNGLSPVSYAVGANNLPLLRELIRRGGNLKEGVEVKVGSESIYEHILKSQDEQYFKLKAFLSTELK